MGTAAVLLPASSGAAAAGSKAAVPVRVVVNGAAEYLTAADLAAITDTQLTTFQSQIGGAGDGGSIDSNQELVSGATMSGLVTLLGLSTDNVKGVVVSNGTGRDDQALSPADIDPGFLGDPGHDPCTPHCQAFISTGYSGGKTAQFSRPERSADDVNGNYPGTPDGNVLTVAITTDGGSVIPMSATVSNAHPNAGDSLHFSAVPAGSFPPGTRLSWNFDDGSVPQTDASEDYAFAENGTYAVTVTAIAPDGSHGVASVTVQVGAVPTGDAAASTPQIPTDDAAAGGGGSGGNGSGGGSAATGSGTGGAKSAATGAAKGGAHGDSTSTTKKSSGTAVPRSGDVAASTKTKSTTEPTPTRSGRPASTNVASELRASTSPAATSAAATTPGTTPASTTPAGAAGPPDLGATGAVSAGAFTRISGLAVDGDGRGPSIAAALAAADALASQTPPRSAARAAAGHGTRVAGAATGGLVIIGLLGLGAAREWRRLPKALPT